MTRVSKNPIASAPFLVLLLTAAFLLLPISSLAAKTLASKALAEAVEDDTLDQVRQEILMDAHAKQKYEFDEAGIEDLGRGLGDRGKSNQALEILQLNQMIFSDSPRAANALGDAYRATGNEITARMYYDMALQLDPDNEHAKQARAEQGEAQEVTMGGMSGMEMDPAEMQAALAQAGVEMTPEQMENMKQAQAQLEAYQQNPEAMQAAEKQQAEERQKAAQRKASSSAAEPAHESEFCEVLHRFNADKKITDPQVRSRVEGQYANPAALNRSWNVETACGDFLIAVPLWADVSPPVMKPVSANRFEDAMGGTWDFQMDSGGKPSSVTYTSSDGTVSEMNRLGDPVSLD